MRASGRLTPASKVVRIQVELIGRRSYRTNRRCIWIWIWIWIHEESGALSIK